MSAMRKAIGERPTGTGKGWKVFALDGRYMETRWFRDDYAEKDVRASLFEDGYYSRLLLEPFE